MAQNVSCCITRIFWRAVKLKIFPLLSFQGMLELFSGLGLMAGPAVGGVLYKVITDLFSCLFNGSVFDQFF